MHNKIALNNMIMKPRQSRAQTGIIIQEDTSKAGLKTKDLYYT
jgi:hypothetical protein